MRILLFAICLFSLQVQAATFGPRSGSFTNLTSYPTASLNLEYEGSTSYLDPLSKRWTTHESRRISLRWFNLNYFQTSATSVPSAPWYLKRSSSIFASVRVPGTEKKIYCADLSVNSAQDTLLFVRIAPASLTIVDKSGRSLEEYLRRVPHGFFLQLRISKVTTGEPIIEDFVRTNAQGSASLLSGNQYFLLNQVKDRGVRIQLTAIEQSRDGMPEKQIAITDYTAELGERALEPLNGTLRSNL